MRYIYLIQIILFYRTIVNPIKEKLQIERINKLNFFIKLILLQINTLASRLKHHLPYLHWVNIQILNHCVKELLEYPRNQQF